jgi:hypothetical protein
MCPSGEAGSGGFGTIQLQHTAHYGEDALQGLNATYPGRWTGCRGPISWPPRSPDVVPMHLLFLMGTYEEERLWKIPP